MNKEYKIFLEPGDGSSEAVEKIKKGKGDKIILHIPEDSVLKSSIDNFYAIRDEIALEDKEVLIESVDPYIEEIAERAGLRAINPIFGKEEKFISDIIPRGQNRKLKSEDIPEFSPEKEEKTYEFFSAPKKEKKKKEKKEERAIMPVDKKKRTLVIAGTFTTLLLIGFLAVNILPKADIEVTLKKSSLSFDETVIASADIHEAVADEEGITLPGELLVATKNIEKRFPASGEEEVQRKATGELYIFNEFSSNSQVLVATTRFVSPDGKVFRLDERVTVPGAEVVGGEIFPQKIKVSVTADKAGEEYNIEPDPKKKWTIPGFKEAGLTERYNGFYTKPASSMEGGYSGISKVPTEEDVEKAKKEVEELLKSALKSQITIAHSKDFKTLEGIHRFGIIEMEIDERVDEEDQFSVFAEGEIKTFVFEEETLKETLIRKNASPLDFDFHILESEIEYSEPEVNWDENSITFSVKGSFKVEPKVNEDNLRTQLVGQTESMVKPVLFSIPDLEKARISLWPFWVKKVPDNPKKVNIELK